MAESVTLEFIGQQLKTLIGEVHALRGSVDAMRSELDGAFHMMRSVDSRVEGLRMIVDAHGQRLTALERAK